MTEQKKNEINFKPGTVVYCLYGLIYVECVYLMKVNDLHIVRRQHDQIKMAVSLDKIKMTK